MYELNTVFKWIRPTALRVLVKAQVRNTPKLCKITYPTDAFTHVGTPKASTPKKRSKWDHDDDDSTPVEKPPPKKKKIKSSSTAASTSPSSDVAALSIVSAPSTPLHAPLPDAASTSAPTPAPAPTARRPPRNRSAFVPSRASYPSFSACRSVYCYERLNHIEEGSYGVVFRAREKATGDIVAIKKLKLDEEKNGFPITSLREVMALMICRHENVVPIREIVVGDTLTQYVSLSPRVCIDLPLRCFC